MRNDGLDDLLKELSPADQESLLRSELSGQLAKSRQKSRSLAESLGLSTTKEDWRTGTPVKTPKAELTDEEKERRRTRVIYTPIFLLTLPVLMMTEKIVRTPAFQRMTKHPLGSVVAYGIPFGGCAACVYSGYRLCRSVPDFWDRFMFKNAYYVGKKINATEEEELRRIMKGDK